jgi:hypothetical protein
MDEIGLTTTITSSRQEGLVQSIVNCVEPTVSPSPVALVGVQATMVLVPLAFVEPDFVPELKVKLPVSTALTEMALPTVEPKGTSAVIKM